MARMLTQAAPTGAFGVVFARSVEVTTDARAVGALLGVSFAAGVPGSLFARPVLRPGRPVDGAGE